MWRQILSIYYRLETAFMPNNNRSFLWHAVVFTVDCHTSLEPQVFKSKKRIRVKVKVFKEKAPYRLYFSWLPTTAIRAAAQNFLTWFLHWSSLKRAARDGDLRWNRAGIHLCSAIVSALCFCIVFFFPDHPQKPCCRVDEASLLRLLFRRAHNLCCFWHLDHRFHVTVIQSYLSGHQNIDMVHFKKCRQDRVEVLVKRRVTHTATMS